MSLSSRLQDKGLVFWITGKAEASIYSEWHLSVLVRIKLAKMWIWQVFHRPFLPSVAFFKMSNHKFAVVQIFFIIEGKKLYFLLNFFILAKMPKRREMPGERRGAWRAVGRGEKARRSGINSGTAIQMEGESTVREMAQLDKDSQSWSADSTAIHKRSQEGRGTNGHRKTQRGSEGKRVKRCELTEEAE